jgi:hypothetical protein
MTSREIERANRASFLAQKTIEEVKSKALADFSLIYTCSATAFSGTDSMFKYTVSDNGNTAIKTISVKVWFDKNGNGSINTDEEWIELNTKAAKRE